MSRPPATQYSISLRVTLDNVPGALGRLATAIGEAGGNIYAVDAFVAKGSVVERDIVVNCRSVEHQTDVVEAVRNTPGITLHDWWDRTFQMHEGGKIEVLALCPVGDRDDLSMAYTPGVARVCMAIADDESLADEYTIRKNTVAIVSDGTAVLGLGDIGPEARDAGDGGQGAAVQGVRRRRRLPDLSRRPTPDEIIETVVRLAPTFGGINLEDIAAPGCFEIEERAQGSSSTSRSSTTTSTAPRSSSWRRCRTRCRIIDKKMRDLPVVIAGVGAAGVACGKILLEAGVTEIVGVDSQGRHLRRARAASTRRSSGSPRTPTPTASRARSSEVLHGADVFIGVCAPDVIDRRRPRARWPTDPIVFAMANPTPRSGPRRSRPRAGHGHRPQRLPEPDQQRAGVPRHLPWCARRRRPTSPRT